MPKVIKEDKAIVGNVEITYLTLDDGRRIISKGDIENLFSRELQLKYDV